MRGVPNKVPGESIFPIEKNCLPQMKKQILAGLSGFFSEGTAGLQTDARKI